VMTNQNRKLMASRITSLIPTHDMNSAPLDPARQKMKGSRFFCVCLRISEPCLNSLWTCSSFEADNWDVWIHISLYACEGLMDRDVLLVWAAFREAYIIHTQQKLTAESRVKAKALLRKYGEGCQRELGITACTLATHQAVVEADYQIEYTGPLPETMASYIERFNLRVVEPVRRRRVCRSPETGIIRGYLLEQFAFSNRGYALSTTGTHSQDPLLYDLEETEPKVLMLSSCGDISPPF